MLAVVTKIFFRFTCSTSAIINDDKQEKRNSKTKLG